VSEPAGIRIPPNKIPFKFIYSTIDMNYDEWDDYEFLTYLAHSGFRFSQSECPYGKKDCSEFTLLRGWRRRTIGEDWYYSLLFRIDENKKINCCVEYNEKRNDNIYTREYVNNTIIPDINEYIANYGLFDETKINSFVIGLITDAI
jgi:hypothetical protein